MAPTPGAADRLGATRIGYTLDDLRQRGERHGFSYRCLGPAQPAADRACLIEGRVEEAALPHGLSLVLSDIHTHHAYESSSRQARRFSAIVNLDGEPQLRLRGGAPVALQAGMALSAAYGEAHTMIARHPGGQRLRGANLSVADPHTLPDADLADRLHRVLHASAAGTLRPWRLPPHLTQSIASLFDPVWQGPLLALLREGVALQLLAHALHQDDDTGLSLHALPARDRVRLERVREHLEAHPGHAHTLTELAQLACMSPSTLRAKFQAAYGCPVFVWLRNRRLELARQGLYQGWSVQQAADYVGYRHPGNFAAAFRRRFGRAPSQDASPG